MDLRISLKILFSWVEEWLFSKLIHRFISRLTSTEPTNNKSILVDSALIISDALKRRRP